MEEMNGFLSFFKNPTTRIDQLITLTSAAVVSRNMQYIASILCAIKYCGRQGIALRGHRDNGALFEEASSRQGIVLRGHRGDGALFEEASSNRGNFKELIMLMQG